jgi:hypothetical protein
MKSKEQYKLEEYLAAAATLGTSISHLMAIDSDGPRCEQSQLCCQCANHHCGWFTACYPEFRGTVAEKWAKKNY